MIATAARSPNVVAQRLIGRDYLSYSALSTYAACPLRFYFRYVQRLPERTVAASLVFGGAIHSALELHYRELLAGNPPPSVQQMLAAFQASWQERAEGVTIRFGRYEDDSSLGALAERMLAAFQSSKLSQPAGRILAIEEELRGKLAPGMPELLARLDLVIEDATSLQMIDFKTARRRWSPSQVDGAAEQLRLYSAVASQLAPRKRLELRFIVLTKGKTPEVGSYAVPHDSGRLERTRRIAARIWRAIADEHFYPAPAPATCGGCPFRGPCERWQG